MRASLRSACLAVDCVRAAGPILGAQDASGWALAVAHLRIAAFLARIRVSILGSYKQRDALVLETLPSAVGTFPWAVILHQTPPGRAVAGGC